MECRHVLSWYMYIHWVGTHARAPIQRGVLDNDPYFFHLRHTPRTTCVCVRFTRERELLSPAPALRNNDRSGAPSSTITICGRVSQSVGRYHEGNKCCTSLSTYLPTYHTGNITLLLQKFNNCARHTSTITDNRHSLRITTTTTTTMRVSCLQLMFPWYVPSK